MKLNEIIDLHEIGGIEQIEFINLLEKRWTVLNKQIRKATSGDSTWNDFQMWKSEIQDINNILEKIS
jgi:hypothetical protein